MDDLISRQAVKELAHNQMREKYCGIALKEQRDFYIKLADSIIDLLPSIQPATNCSEFPNNSDAISRQAAIDALRKMQTYKMFSGDDMLLIDQAGAMTELMLLPPAEPKRGKWIDKGWTGDWQYLTDGRGNCWRNIVCSECGESVRHESNFCPNCGAKMEVTE